MTPLTVGSPSGGDIIEKLTVLDLFSGIGGFSLGLQRTGGFETIAFCEIDPFCRKVLAKHWPGVPCFEDITKLDKEELNSLGRIDVICGGFPCQPVSCAGKRKGKEDTRWLWPEFCRVVRCVRPEWVLIENVPGLLSADSGRLFAGILRDLSESGYDAEWNIVSAASVGAPHLRKRVFVVAHTMQQRTDGRQENSTLLGNGRTQSIIRSKLQGKSAPFDVGRDGESQRNDGKEDVANPEIPRFEITKRASGPKSGFPRSERGRIFRREPTGTWPIESGFCRMVDGIPNGVDRLRALGNAIVPQCAQFVGRCLLDSIEMGGAQ